MPQNLSLKQSVANQRISLSSKLQLPLGRVAKACGEVWADRAEFDRVLMACLPDVPHCKFLYVLDSKAIQISDNICRQGIISQDFGRDRSGRPYFVHAPDKDYYLSDAYISLRAKRPSLTAIHCIRDSKQNILGFLGADFDLRDLPLTSEHYHEPNTWRQIRGDPSIRKLVFHQHRETSLVDVDVDNVIALLDELIIDNGVFQLLLHFSSNRATIWTFDDPFRYRILDIEALTDPDTCLAFPRINYPANAIIPADDIRPVLELIKQLRFMDDTIYLRSCSINIFNGLVSLTFSCDGTHYLPHREFLQKDVHFWL